MESTALNTLIKMHNFTLESQVKRLAKMRADHESIERYAHQLEDELETERVLASRDPAMSIPFAAYRRAMDEKRENVRQMLEGLERDITRTQEGIMDARAEAERYKLIAKQRRDVQARQESQREVKRLDEIGLRQFVVPEE